MFKSGFVLHYIKEYSLTEFKKTKKILEENIENKIFEDLEFDKNVIENISENLPIGTTICIDMSVTEKKKTVICYPMFSSHISLPVKPGEIVWFYKDTETQFANSTKNTAPMMFIENYWLSRKIGSRISEDLNYSHIQRDSLINEKVNSIQKRVGPDSEYNSRSVLEKIDDRIEKKEIQKTIKLPDYKNTNVYSQEYTFLPDTSKIYADIKLKKELYPAAVPRWSSKPYELSLQGSNNSLINLTKTFNTSAGFKDKGAIDLVAGRHVIENYLEENNSKDHIKIENKIIVNEHNDDERNLNNITFDKSKAFITISNIEKDDEVLKSEKFYFGKDIKDYSSFREGFKSIRNDASRLYITEFDQIDNNSYYNISNLQNQKIINFEDQIENTYNREEFLTKEKNINFSNFKTNTINPENLLLPSIFLKSNNIRIVSREKTGQGLEEGSIRIIKDSNESQNRSHIAMERNGQIAIDGKTLMLGNLKKELVRQKIIKDIEEEINDETDLSSVRGKGSSLFIGYDEKISEPLVLGNTLESLLKELIHINISLVEEIKILTDDLQKHIHLGIPGSGVSGPPQVPAPYSNFSTTSQEDLKNRYSKIQNNLKDMLSIFAKTS